MVWNATSPDGTKSVAVNQPLMQQNTTYTETTMNVDHYWNDDPETDGHHQFVQTVATNDADSSLETNASLATGMDGVFYSRFKTPTEMTGSIQDVQSYFINQTGIIPTTNVLQLLGIRACVVFNVASNNITTTPYKHNVSSVTRNSTGDYTITFATDLPTANYLVYSGGIRANTSNTFLISSVKGSNAVGDNKKVKSCRIVTGTENGSVVDPLQVWFVCFGG